jgi:hypothetical protein
MTRKQQQTRQPVAYPEGPGTAAGLIQVITYLAAPLSVAGIATHPDWPGPAWPLWQVALALGGLCWAVGGVARRVAQRRMDDLVAEIEQASRRPKRRTARQ